MTTVLLNKFWAEILADLSIPEDVSDKWLSLMETTYKPRICYNLPYLDLKLKHFEEIKSLLKSPQGVFLALIFQTFYYDTKSTDNADKCNESFRQFAQESGIIDKNAELVKVVTDLIELSVTNSTEEHLTPGIFGDEDRHYFLDINHVIWASDWEEYSEFSGRTRREYEFLNDTAYTSLRLKVLQSLLLIPNLFATKDFRSKHEDAARGNIKKEINSLK